MTTQLDKVLKQAPSLPRAPRSPRGSRIERALRVRSIPERPSQTAQWALWSRGSSRIKVGQGQALAHWAPVLLSLESSETSPPDTATSKNIVELLWSELVKDATQGFDISASTSLLAAVTQAKQEANSGKSRRGLDTVFNAFDDLLLEGKFRECDWVLFTTDPCLLPEVLAVGILSVTLPAMRHLKNRDRFRELLRRHIMAKGGQVEMLDGL